MTLTIRLNGALGLAWLKEKEIVMKLAVGNVRAVVLIAIMVVGMIGMGTLVGCSDNSDGQSAPGVIKGVDTAEEDELTTDIPQDFEADLVAPKDTSGFAQFVNFNESYNGVIDDMDGVELQERVQTALKEAGYDPDIMVECYSEVQEIGDDRVILYMSAPTREVYWSAVYSASAPLGSRIEVARVWDEGSLPHFSAFDEGFGLAAQDH